MRSNAIRRIVVLLAALLLCLPGLAVGQGSVNYHPPSVKSYVLCSSATSTVTATTDEEVAFSCVFPAGFLKAGDIIRATAFNKTAANANTKITRFRLSGLVGTQMCANSGTYNNLKMWWRFHMMIVGAANQTWYCDGTKSDGNAITPQSGITTNDLTDSATLVFTQAGAVAAADLTAEGWIVELLRQ